MKSLLKIILLLLSLLAAGCAAVPDPGPQYPIDVEAFLSKTAPGVYKVNISGECEPLLVFDGSAGIQLGYNESAISREFRIQQWQRLYSVAIQTPISLNVGNIYTLTISRRGDFPSINGHNVHAELLGFSNGMYYFAGKGDNCAYILKSFKEGSL